MNISQKIARLVRYYSSIMGEFGVEEMAGRVVKLEEESLPQKTVIEEKPIIEKQTRKVEFTKKSTVKMVESSLKNQEVGIQKTEFVASLVDLKNVHSLEDLQKIANETKVCEIQQFATNIVFADGNKEAKILVVGEAPGQEEDESGVPFCGRSGTLLMNAFASIGLKREDNFLITNNVFWRPPGNRKPTNEELCACKPFLERIIEIVKPEVVLCVGAVASQNILETDLTITAMRKKLFDEVFPKSLKFKTKVFCVYHPSYLLRSPAKKYDMYQDLVFISEHIPHLL